jgi:hypothetical protein
LIFEYRYRDAANFKAHGALLLEGSLSVSERQELTDRLESGEFFVAEQVGIPPLYGALEEWSNGPTEDDHGWHEFAGFRDGVGQPADAHRWGEAKSLLSKFRSVSDWDASLSRHFSL